MKIEVKYVEVKIYGCNGGYYGNIVHDLFEVETEIYETKDEVFAYFTTLGLVIDKDMVELVEED